MGGGRVVSYVCGQKKKKSKKPPHPGGPPPGGPGMKSNSSPPPFSPRESVMGDLAPIVDDHPEFKEDEQQQGIYIYIYILLGFNEEREEGKGWENTNSSMISVYSPSLCKFV